MAAGKEYDHVSTSPDYPRGGLSEVDWDLEGWSRGMTWPACKQSLAILQVYAGIVLLEEKIVSNILKDWQDMCVKASIHIRLACKWPRIIMQIKLTLYEAQGDLLFISMSMYHVSMTKFAKGDNSK